MSFSGDRFALEQLVHHAAQVLTRHWNIIAWPRSVELPSIDAPALSVKHAEVGSACRVVRPGNFLGRIVEVGERESLLLRQLLHQGHVVLRIGHHIVA